jgi:hypothetical protein
MLLTRADGVDEAGRDVVISQQFEYRGSEANSYTVKDAGRGVSLMKIPWQMNLVTASTPHLEARADC